jgi:hypothetical protein
MAKSPALMSFVLLLWLASPATPVAEEVRSVPPDHSLSVSAYVAKGLPNPRAKWSEADRDAARDVLWTLWEEDPTLLPRSSSPNSDVVFSRILDTYFQSESLDVFAVLSMGELMTADAKKLERVARKRSFVALYAPRADGLLFDREMIEIAARRTRMMIALLREILASEAQLLEDQTDGAAEDSQMDVGDVLLPALEDLAALSAAEEFSAQARAAGLAQLKAIAAESQELLNPDGQTALRVMIANVEP